RTGADTLHERCGPGLWCAGEPAVTLLRKIWSELPIVAGIYTSAASEVAVSAIKFLAVFVCVALLHIAGVRAQEVPGCGSLENAYGPFDYRDPAMRRERLPIVTRFHFTPNVEMLEHGTSGTILG